MTAAAQVPQLPCEQLMENIKGKYTDSVFRLVFLIHSTIDDKLSNELHTLCGEIHLLLSFYVGLSLMSLLWMVILYRWTIMQITEKCWLNVLAQSAECCARQTLSTPRIFPAPLSVVYLLFWKVIRVSLSRLWGDYSWFKTALLKLISKNLIVDNDKSCPQVVCCNHLSLIWTQAVWLWYCTWAEATVSN